MYGECPVFLAYALNGAPLPLERGGPVRMIVPQGHGNKNVKWLQNIRLTNDFRPADTYASIDEGIEGNDTSAVMKTYTTVDEMRGAPPVPSGQPLVLSGTLMTGRTPVSHLEYWVRPIVGGFQKGAARLEDDDPELLAGPWRRVDLEGAIASPKDLAALLPAGTKLSDLSGFGPDGVPRTWPLPYSYTSWTVSITGLAPGDYEVRARTVDANGNAQPEPRPYHKNGRNSIGVRRVTIASV